MQDIMSKIAAGENLEFLEGSEPPHPPSNVVPMPAPEPVRVRLGPPWTATATTNGGAVTGEKKKKKKKKGATGLPLRFH